MASSRGRTGSLSPHFQAHEFACPHCGVAVVRDELVHRLEILRAKLGRPVPIVDGYRCPVHNAQVGGAANSQHMYGAAVDLPTGLVVPSLALACGFTGVGHKGRYAVHVDVRDGLVAQWAY